MIIVSQDKESIVNYENIEVLGIGNPLENNNAKFGIIANVISDNQYILGEYKTEKRAKEVLQEIINNYANSQIVKLPNMQYEKPIYIKQLSKFICYEMPEE